MSGVTPRAKEAASYLPALDGLRALAILVVFVHHAPLILDAPLPFFEGAGRLTSGGWMGVDLFFVLSGFLITGILLRTRSVPGALVTFLKRRALRIFPLAYLCLGVIYASAELIGCPARLQNYPAWHMWAFYVGNVRVMFHG